MRVAASRVKMLSDSLGDAPRQDGRHGVAYLTLRFSHSRRETEVIRERLQSRRFSEGNAPLLVVVPLNVAVVFGPYGGGGPIGDKPPVALFGTARGFAPGPLVSRFAAGLTLVL